MSEEKTITITDEGAITLADGQFQLQGIGDIWGVIGKLLKLNLIEHARKLIDMLVANPDKYTVTQLLAQIKQAIADISGQTLEPVGPPKLPLKLTSVETGKEVYTWSNRGSLDDIRNEIEKRGGNAKALPICLILTIAQLLIRFGPDIWEKIMDMIGRKESKQGKVKEVVASIVLAIALLFAGSAQAQYQTKFLPVTVSYLAEPAEYLPEPTESDVKEVATTGSEDALAEVNAYRAKRGLAPFKHDAQLTQAAYEAAKRRASRGIHGHLPESDFSCLPAGANADAAGCGALDDSWGWATCCMDDSYSHAGAAWVRGSDGRRYMHLFCRNQVTAANSTTQTTQTETMTCTSGTCYTSDSTRTRGIFRRSRGYR